MTEYTVVNLRNMPIYNPYDFLIYIYIYNIFRSESLNTTIYCEDNVREQNTIEILRAVIDHNKHRRFVHHRKRKK